MDSNILYTIITVIILIVGSFIFGLYWKKNKVQKDAQDAINQSKDNDAKRKEAIKKANDELEKEKPKDNTSTQDIIDKNKEMIDNAKKNSTSN